jgi:hypothetical protein
MAARVIPFMLALGLFACGGASPSDVLDPVAKPVAPGSGASGASGAPSGGASQTGAAPGASAPAAATTPTSPTAPATTVNPQVPTPEVPPTACVIARNNDAAESATTFTSCVTGTVDRTDGARYVQIVAPNDARTITIAHTESARVFYQVTVETSDGQLAEFPLLADSDTELRATPGATYLFRVVAGRDGTDGDPRTYEVTASFTSFRSH